MTVTVKNKRLYYAGNTIVGIAMIWWYVVFSKVESITKMNSGKLLVCGIYTTKLCGRIDGSAELMGHTAYNPILLWVGFGLIAASKMWTNRQN